MTRRHPTVLPVMTPFPYSVDAEESIDVARAMMHEHGIHHLPVMHDGRLGGIISARDIGLCDALLDRPRAVPLPVWAVCTRDPYIVELDTPLEAVVRHLADVHIGSAIVTKHGKLAGIVTMTDLCRLLASMLEDTEVEGGDDDAA
ncbi:MAG: CBS domain-containing protein [Myxococcales bacterium]|nr:CBS domain-containing protein [Myxococcales bacterium]